MVPHPSAQLDVLRPGSVQVAAGAAVLPSLLLARQRASLLPFREWEGTGDQPGSICSIRHGARLVIAFDSRHSPSLCRRLRPSISKDQEASRMCVMFGDKDGRETRGQANEAAMGTEEQFGTRVITVYCCRIQERAQEHAKQRCPRNSDLNRDQLEFRSTSQPGSANSGFRKREFYELRANLRTQVCGDVPAMPKMRSCFHARGSFS